MKPKTYWLYLIILTLIIIILVYPYYNQDTNRLTNEELIEIVNPTINEFCQNLSYSARLCPTCYSNEFKLVKEFTQQKTKITEYTLEKKGQYAILNIRQLTLDSTNSRINEVKLYFKINKNGNIVEKFIPAIPCI